MFTFLGFRFIKSPTLFCDQLGTSGLYIHQMVFSDNNVFWKVTHFCKQWYLVEDGSFLDWHGRMQLHENKNRLLSRKEKLEFNILKLKVEIDSIGHLVSMNSVIYKNRSQELRLLEKELDKFIDN